MTRPRRRSKARAAPPRHPERLREEERAARWYAAWYATPRKVILSAGALAGAIASILALTGTVRAMFESGPEGKVKVLKIQDVTPLTYGGWVIHEGGKRENVPPAQVGLPGRLITYRVVTEGFEKNSKLPVRLILHDLSTGGITAKEGDPIKVVHGNDCGCSDWVLTPRRGHRYKIEIQVFPPGEIEGTPEQIDYREFATA